jgi:hypothetical protein
MAYKRIPTTVQELRHDPLEHIWIDEPYKEYNVDNPEMYWEEEQSN